MFWKRKPKDELRSFLPDFEVVHVMQVLSQKVDWGLKMLGIEETWKKTKGDGIKVCVLDTGRPLNHSDVESNIYGAANFTTPDEDEFDRVSGHSTHCGGIVGALDNQQGIIGVAPECELYFGKVLSNSGMGKFDWIADGIQWAIDLQVDIISMSLGSTAQPPNNRIKKLLEKAVSRNIIPVAAAGNEGSKNINFPARYDCCLAVSAVDKHKHITSWSNTGTQIDVTAPGQDIYSTHLNGGYAILSGTSQATPFISGIVALMMAYHRVGEHSTPCRNLQEVKEHLAYFSDDLGQLGKDNTYGYGLPNLTKMGVDTPSSSSCACDKENKGCMWPF